MTEETRKRLEEAAENTLNGLNNNCYIHIDENTEDAYKDGFRDGGEWMFNEAGGEMVLREMRRMIIHQAKEWLEENFFTKVDDNAFLYWDSNFNDITEALADFEADMNKLWEGEK